MTTTTLAAVVAQWATVLRALTPTVNAGRKFDRCPPDMSLGEFAAGPGGAGARCLRIFEAVEVGTVEEIADFMTALLCRRSVTLSIAYPAKLRGLFGIGGMVDVESLIEKDARQVRDAIFSAGNYVAGQEAAFVTRLPLRREGSVWFQDFQVDVQLFESQTLT